MSFKSFGLFEMMRKTIFRRLQQGDLTVNLTRLTSASLQQINDGNMGTPIILP